MSDALGQLCWLWRELPRDWKLSALAILIMGAYLVAEIACLF